MPYKNPESVLVIIYHQTTKDVLMLRRKDDPTFWQSVTGSLEQGETPYQAAIREVKEETGIDILKDNLPLFDCQKWIAFEIFPQFRYKYAPYVTTVKEHWFLLPLADKSAPFLSEHSQSQWVTPKNAAKLTKSWNNRQAIQSYLCESENKD